METAIGGGELAGNDGGQSAADAASQLGEVGGGGKGVAEGLENRLQIADGYALGQEVLKDLVNLGYGKPGVVVRVMLVPRVVADELGDQEGGPLGEVGKKGVDGLAGEELACVGLNNVTKMAGQDPVGRNNCISELASVGLGCVGNPKSRALGERIGEGQTVQSLGGKTGGQGEELAGMDASAENL